MGKKKVKLSWKVHLLRQSGASGVAVMLALVLLLWAAWVLLASPILWLLIVLVFLGSLSDYLCPIRYRLSETEIVVVTPMKERHFPWSNFRSFTNLPRGVQLRRLKKPSFLDAFRSVNLYYDKCNKKQVLSFVQQKLQT